MFTKDELELLGSLVIFAIDTGVQNTFNLEELKILEHIQIKLIEESR